MLGSLHFESSMENTGLQAADIVASALTRALNGSLQIEGWRDLGRLLIRRNDGSSVSFARLAAEDDDPRERVPEAAAVVLRALNSSAKSMEP